MFRIRRQLRETIAWTVAAGAVAVAGIAVAAGTGDAKYEAASQGTRWLESPSGLKVKMLVDKSNLGGSELEFGEITFPADYQKSPPHKHGQVELFYVIEGKLGHIVNGVKHVIEPGMVGIVRPGDQVEHSVESDGPVRGLVIWAPAGEADTLIKAGVFKPRPIDEP